MKKQTPTNRLRDLRRAYAHLKHAQTLATAAGAPKTAQLRNLLRIGLEPIPLKTAWQNWTPEETPEPGNGERYAIDTASEPEKRGTMSSAMTRDAKGRLQKTPLRIRFDAKWKLEAETGCWIWKGATKGDYGIIRLTGEPRSESPAHRVAWMLYRGPIPSGLCVLHQCDKPLCVNPDHLFIGTHSDNVADKVAKNRQARGETHASCRLTASQVEIIRQSVNATTRQLAAHFGISQRHVRHIVNGQKWKHLLTSDVNPRDIDTPIREDQDRRDWLERREAFSNEGEIW